MRIELLSRGTVVGKCIVATVMLLGMFSTSGARDQALANALANDNTRQGAVASITASGRSKVTLLLSWTRTPPHGVAECGLYTGLADAFGELKTKEAISFLIKNISLYRSCGISLSPWLKVPAVIEWNLPAVGALIKIGPEASKALMTSLRSLQKEEDRRAAIFVISRVKGVPETRAFLELVSVRANRERLWAEEALKDFDRL